MFRFVNYQNSGRIYGICTIHSRVITHNRDTGIPIYQALRMWWVWKWDQPVAALGYEDFNAIYIYIYTVHTVSQWIWVRPQFSGKDITWITMDVLSFPCPPAIFPWCIPHFRIKQGGQKKQQLPVARTKVTSRTFWSAWLWFKVSKLGGHDASA